MRAAALALLALLLTVAVAASAGPDFVRLAPGALHWTEVPGSSGVQQAVLFGNPEQPGPYVVRVRFPPHVMDRPHFHPKARYVTVLEGTWYAGTGPHFDPGKATPLPAGSFMVHPAQAAHWDGSAADGPVVVQITGEGPGTTTLVDPGLPMWIDLRQSRH